MQPSSEPIGLAQILHWNRPVECLETVRCFASVRGLQVQVVDNGSTQAELNRLKSDLPGGATLLELVGNRGWGPGHNVGIRNWLASQRSEFCLLAAHDARPQAGCVEGLLRAMQQDPSLGALCPQYPTGEVGAFDPVRGPRTVAAERPTRPAVQAVDYAHGTLTVYRRAALDAAGLFDERYFAYGDEVDLSLRIRRHGWNVGMLWGAVVVNPGTWTPQPVVAYLSTRNSLLLARDYGGRGRALVRAGLAVCNSARMVLACRKQVGKTLFPFARLRGIYDYLRGTYGAPPTHIGTPAPEREQRTRSIVIRAPG